MLSNTLNEKELTDLLIHTNELLQAEQVPGSRSISFGVVHGDCADYKSLIETADNRMYQHKLKHYETMARS